MNKKEVNEIKRTMTPENCAITHIAGCYVDIEKNIKTTISNAFLLLTEEEQFKYFTLFKKALGGKIGKTLINLEFPTEQESVGGTQDELYKITKSSLKDEKLLNAFYEKIIDAFNYDDNYFILLAHGTYDIPSKSLDGSDLEDSEYVYDFTLCLLCPMKLSKAGLSYDESKNSICNIMRNMMIEDPIHSYLYPAFNDRNTDIHSVLYYSKKAEGLSESFIEGVLGCAVPGSANKQDELFIDTVESCVENLTFDKVKAIYENVREHELIHDNEEPCVLGKMESVALLRDSGVSKEDAERFGEEFDKQTKAQGEVLMSNLFNGSDKMEIRSGHTKITLPAECADFVSIREVDGVKSLVIHLSDSLEVNGMNIKNY